MTTARDVTEARALSEQICAHFDISDDVSDDTHDYIRNTIAVAFAERETAERAQYGELKRTYEGLNAYSMRQSIEITNLRDQLKRADDLIASMSPAAAPSERERWAVERCAVIAESMADGWFTELAKEIARAIRADAARRETPASERVQAP